MLPAAVARADRTYTDPAAWEAGLAGQTIVDLRLPETAVPLAGGTVAGDGYALTFPQNHGGIYTRANGWHGDVHRGEPPLVNTLTFDEPVSAFGAEVLVGGDVGPEFDSILFTFHDTYRLRDVEHEYQTLGFFGWIADEQGVSRIDVTSGASRHFYVVADARFVTGADGIPVILEPGGGVYVAAAGCLCLTLTRWTRIAS